MRNTEGEKFDAIELWGGGGGGGGGGGRCTEIYSRMVPRGTITKLHNFHWSLSRSADSTANKCKIT